MRLYLLQLALRPVGGVPVPGYLIQTAHGTILVDSGFPKSFVSPDGTVGKSGWLVREEDHVVNRLAQIGLRPANIHYVVCTHLDPDHAGSHNLFSTAEFIIQRRHEEFAQSSGHPRVGPPHAHWRDPQLHYRQINGDTTLVPGVDLIETSGHVPGHQSVLVRLPNTGPVLLAIDAIPRATLTDADTREIQPADMDEAATRASTRKLMQIARREHALLIHGHDSAQWATLKKSPEFYD